MSSYSTDKSLNEINEKAINKVIEEGKTVVVIGNKDSACKLGIMLGTTEVICYPNPELDRKEQEEEAASIYLDKNKLHVCNNLDYLRKLVLKNENDINIVRIEHHNYNMIFKLFSKDNARAMLMAGYDIR